MVKFIPKDPGAQRELLFEDLTGAQNVVPILDCGECGDCWILVMPKAEKSLRDHLEETGGQLSVNAAVKILANVAEALVAIEGRVVHRDIKPENILLLNGYWCLADFGISRYAEATTGTHTRKHAMTAPYAAPEQWRGDRAVSATDVYATGVVGYEVLAGKRPFAGPDFRHQHLHEHPDPIARIPMMLQSLIADCLHKSPQARPRAENLVARLRAIGQPASEAAERLQRANAQAVSKQAEIDRLESLARSEEERGRQLGRAAAQSLAHVVRMLDDQISLHASASERSGSSWSLNGANLRVAPIRATTVPARGGAGGAQLEVVAYTDIELRIPNTRMYEGRSHSLWYCDARQRGKFRWYETAFMTNPRLKRTSRIAPFALNPGQEAYGALGRTLAVHQCAWPFTAIDQGSEQQFIDRWMAWFADAANGILFHPSRMPELDPSGSWRYEE